MVGTHRKPSPDDQPLLKLESKSKLEMFFEAMKVMNEIQSETNGEIVEILVEDSESVEYSQPYST